MRRFLAFVLAGAMVVTSLYVRSRIDDSGDASAGSGDGGRARVVCSTELAAACDALDAADASTTVEDAGRTADRLVATDAPAIDVWIAPAPWPEIVDIRRDQAQREPLFDRSIGIAGTRLAMVAWKGALQCSGEPSWRCVGDSVARGVKPGHADPTRDGIGLLVLGQAAVSFFGGRTDLSTIDLEDAGFDAWFGQLEQATTVQFDDPLTRMLVQGRSAFDVVGVSEAAADDVLTGAAGRERVEVLYPAPMARAVAVMAPVRGRSGAGSLRAAATDALVRAGWSRATTPQGLPDAGFLDALLERWKEAVR